MRKFSHCCFQSDFLIIYKTHFCGSPRLGNLTWTNLTAEIFVKIFKETFKRKFSAIFTFKLEYKLFDDYKNGNPDTVSIDYG